MVIKDLKAMNYFTINGLKLKPSCLAIGTWQLGGHGWGPVSETDVTKAVERSLDLGINVIDTSPIYGLGKSEERLGKILKGRREEVILATKCGLSWDTKPVFKKNIDCSPENIKAGIYGSLERLKTDYIDIYQVHWPDPKVPVHDTLNAMEELKADGIIRCIGVCNFPLSLLQEVSRSYKIDTLQVPYNLVDREVEKEILPFCHKENISVLAYGPLAKGLLSGRYGMDATFADDDNRYRDWYFRREEREKNLNIVNQVKITAQKNGCTPTQVALTWILSNKYVKAAIFGAKNISQAEENIKSIDISLSESDMQFLE